jgi:FeS assembly SUF system protein
LASDVTQAAETEDDADLTQPPMTQGCPGHRLWPQIEGALRTVYDPEIPVNIYELGLIYTVTAADRADGQTDLEVTMSLTSPGCPVAQEMPGWVQSALLAVPEVGDVDVALVWDPPWSAEMMSPTAKMELNLFGGGMF